MIIFFKLRLWGCRLVPTDVKHQILTSAHSPFIFLRSFTDGAHRSKTYFIILSDTHALCNVHACLRPTETTFFTTGQNVPCVRETPGIFVRKCAKTIFAGFKVYSETHACLFGHTCTTHVCLTGGCNQFYFF